MVKAAREAPSPGALRALNLPERVQVEVDEGGWPKGIALDPHAGPSALATTGAVKPRPYRRRQPSTSTAVISTEDIWRVEEEWWRDTPVSRTYFEVLLEDGQRITIFHDAVSRLWQKQRYG
ncbi:MAG: hypothetical protein V3S98_08945 [Dehalococcoidia bacterium]